VSNIVNRRVVEFLLYELLDLEQLFASRRYGACDRAAVAEVLDTAQAIAEDKYLPIAAAIDAREPQFVEGKVAIMPEVGEALRAYAAAGFFAAGFDEDVGGLQLPSVVTIAVNGIFSCANISIANYAFLTIAAAQMLNAFGTPEQKQLFLPPMLEGRWFGTMCLSEPQAGSSLSDIQTRAEPMDDGRYRIRGAKMWISGGDHELSENIIHMVLAKTPDGPPGVKGISLFIVPRYRVNEDGSCGDWNNIALAGLNHKMGHRGTTNCLLNFGETGDCIGYLVGDLHQGLQYMFHMMNEARVGVGHGAVMSALGAYLYSLDYACTRLQGRHPQAKDPSSPQVPIIEHADVKRMLMAQKAAVEGGLSLIMYCAHLIDVRKVVDGASERERLGLLLDILTPIAKSWPAEFCLEANKLAIQVLGGYGYTRDYPVERLYRDNRLNHIHEGAYAMHGLDLLGRKVRMQEGAAFRALLNAIGETLAEASATALRPEAAVLTQIVQTLERTTQTVLACADLDVALANATLYLEACGHIVIAWMWLKQALVAIRCVPRGDSDHEFYAGKVAACRYFYRYELPNVATKLALVGALDDTCLRLTPGQFAAV
jgi:butyryl-CoA dehydrogenase